MKNDQFLLPCAVFAFRAVARSRHQDHGRTERCSRQERGNGGAFEQGRQEHASGVFMKLNLHDLAARACTRCTSIGRRSAIRRISNQPVRTLIRTGKKHGLENPEGHHAGDMNNFTVNANGNAKFKVVNKDVTLGDDSHSLFSNGGTALVIHAKADDMKTDPAGNAGDRIACGVITK